MHVAVDVTNYTGASDRGGMGCSLPMLICDRMFKSKPAWQLGGERRRPLRSPRLPTPLQTLNIVKSHSHRGTFFQARKQLALTPIVLWFSRETECEYMDAIVEPGKSVAAGQAGRPATSAGVGLRAL